MYLGRIVESGSAKSVCEKPKHPYTQALISAVPTIDSAGRKKRIVPLGDPPSPLDIPSGCPFHTRCPMAQAICKTDPPPLREIVPGHRSACHFAEQVSPL
jgi:oligopeptide/dipeptide ABC transporter ATP-binding protein